MNNWLNPNRNVKNVFRSERKCVDSCECCIETKVGDNFDNHHGVCTFVTAVTSRFKAVESKCAKVPTTGWEFRPPGAQHLRDLPGELTVERIREDVLDSALQKQVLARQNIRHESSRRVFSSGNGRRAQRGLPAGSPGRGRRCCRGCRRLRWAAWPLGRSALAQSSAPRSCTQGYLLWDPLDGTDHNMW